jgi:hypothetical protein
VQVAHVPAGMEIEPRLLEGLDDQARPFYLFFAFNHTEPQSPDAPAQPFHFAIRTNPGRYSLVDVVTGKPVEASLKGDRLHVSAELKPGEIWLVKIMPA